MRSTVLIGLFGLSCLASAGCASFASNKQSAVRTRAAFDMACPADQLQLVPLTSEAMERASYGVTGCNKKATYIYMPQTGATLDSPIQAASVAAADGPKAN